METDVTFFSKALARKSGAQHAQEAGRLQRETWSENGCKSTKKSLHRLIKLIARELTHATQIHFFFRRPTRQKSQFENCFALSGFFASIFST